MTTATLTALSGLQAARRIPARSGRNRLMPRLFQIRSGGEKGGLGPLDDERAAHAAARARRDHAAAASGLLHRVQKIQQDPRAGRADGVPDRDRAAVRIELAVLVLRFPIVTELLLADLEDRE